jgi:3-methyladenine DNA glycosylase/8-oxoguanine DNA glycosylase
VALQQTTLSFAPTGPFHFADTAHSHGWVTLAPNTWDPERAVMERVHRLPSGRVVLLTLCSNDTSRPSFTATVHHDGDLSADERQNVRAAVAHMFRLDEDLSDFYALCAERGGRWAAVTEGRGRLLRSPTVFEDVVKTICTTNIQWSGTKRMVQQLVDAFGTSHPGDAHRRAFPAPEALAATSRDAFAEAVSLGYRTSYVHELAQRVASGDLNLEALSGPDRPTAELKRTLHSIKGVGHYATATLLMLLGRYDELAVDSVFRQFVSARYFDGERPSDAAAKAIYDDWGEWKYLAYWFDLWNGPGESI